MDSLAIALRALGDYQLTVDTLATRVNELEARIAELETVPPPANGTVIAELQEAPESWHSS